MTADAPSIREARPDDLDALVAIEERSFDSDRLSRRAIRRAIASATQRVLVVEVQGAPVGSAVLGFRRRTRVARLTSIAVLATMAGRGYGVALIRACEAQARARGCDRLILEVRADNAAAIRLYEKAGYRGFGRYEDYYEDGASALRFEKPLF